MDCNRTSIRIASLLAFLVTTALGYASAEAQGSGPWTLTPDQRRAYLVYYSPVLMLRAHEPAGSARGKSWITNFDFDRDRQLRTNFVNWGRTGDYIDGALDTQGWEIRPTLYTSLIEFMEDDGSKSVVLLYHVYHARDERGIHDWERIEIRVDNVHGSPGNGNEQVRFAVITEHLENPARLYGDSGLNFQETATGQHALIWQAQWINTVATGAHNQELRFVEDSFDTIDGRVEGNFGSGVNISNGNSPHNVHYVFVCEGATDAVNYWSARELNRMNAGALASGREWNSNITWGQVVRVRYELQDIADIFPTHSVDHEDIAFNWKGDSIRIDFESPIINEAGDVEVNAGLQEFFLGDRSTESGLLFKDRDGYPNKQWMWGSYDWNGKGNEVKSAMFNGSSDQPNRALASGSFESLGNWWWQHDYFAHDGGSGANPESGHWLSGDWYTDSAGGWDGRWQQIFADNGSDTRRAGGQYHRGGVVSICFSPVYYVGSQRSPALPETHPDAWVTAPAGDPTAARYMALARAAIERELESVPHARVDFVGWDRCASEVIGTLNEEVRLVLELTGGGGSSSMYCTVGPSGHPNTNHPSSSHTLACHDSVGFMPNAEMLMTLSVESGRWCAQQASLPELDRGVESLAAHAAALVLGYGYEGVTPYDPASISSSTDCSSMVSSLSHFDRLGLSIVYPDMAAEAPVVSNAFWIGNGSAIAFEGAVAQHRWLSDGAEIGAYATTGAQLRWQIDFAPSIDSLVGVVVPSGNHQVNGVAVDFMGRARLISGNVEVNSSAAAAILMAVFN